MDKKHETRAVAIKLFATKGYAETTMRDIAQILGIKAASIYSHFKSKEQLLMDICETGIKKLQMVMDEVMLEKDSKARLHLYIFKHLNGIIVTDPNLADVYLKYWRIVDIPGNGKFTAFNLTYWGFITYLFTETFPRQRELPCYVEHATPVYFVSILNSVPRYINPNNIDVKTVADDIYHRLVYGFRTPKSQVEKPIR